MSLNLLKKRWTLDAVRERLDTSAPERRGRQGRSGEVSETREAFRRAAAVLVSFDPEWLLPDGRVGADESAVQLLMEDCSVVASSDASRPARWTLRPDVRREVLRSMGNRGALLRAAEANPQELGAAGQGMLMACILDRLPPLDRCSERELAELLDAVFWLDGTVDGLPDRERIQALLDGKRLLSTFKFLVGTHFQGREHELMVLRGFVGLRTPRSLLLRVRRILGRAGGRPPVLVIHGPGGVGKSTLLAKFLLEHVQEDSGARVPFAYLDFDNPSLSFDDPLGLVLEMVRQLGVQYPEHRKDCEAAISDVRHAGQVDESGPVPAESIVPKAMGALLEKLVGGGSAEDAGGSQKKPFLVVLDTFEEVQYRSSPLLFKTRSFLKSLWAVYPGVRVVISGRVPLPKLNVNGMAPKSLSVPELDEPAALSLLRAHGVYDPDLRADLLKQVGRNPLSLKLAAAVAKHEGSIKDLKTTRFLLFSAKETVIQGQLYQRILGHIHDPDVRKLAHPGLVLRQVTPELIREVLAGPCGIQLTEENSERALFNALKKEVSLVSVAGPDRVKHRSDVRAVMLKLLIRDRPEQVEAIHRAALRFYERGTRIEDRAEELYHWMMMGAELEMLDMLWPKGMEEDLREALTGSLHELPASSQAFLALKLGLFLPEEVRQRADLEAWEQLTAKTVGNSLGGDREAMEYCLNLLHERWQRTDGSPLYYLEAKVLLALGRPSDALRLVENVALPSARLALETEALTKLLCLAGELHRDLGSQDLARQYFLESAELARGRSWTDARMQALLELLQLGSIEDAERKRLGHELAKVFEALPEHARLQDWALLRLVVAYVGADHPGVVIKGIRLLGFNRQAIGPDLREWRMLAEERVRELGSGASEATDYFRKALPWTSERALEHMRDRPYENELEELTLELLTRRPNDRSLLELTARMLGRPFMRRIYPNLPYSP